MIDRRECLFRSAAVFLVVLLAPGRTPAQPPGKVYRIGVLVPSQWSVAPQFSDAFQRGLRELGWMEDQNIRVETRSSDGRDDRFPALAAELVASKIDVIVAVTVPAIRAAQQATKTIPIVMVLSSDPVRMGLVASLARPGGNTTGLASSIQDVASKRVELLKETIPTLSHAVLIWNPANPAMRADWSASATAARTLGINVRPLEIKDPGDLQAAFGAILRDRPEALVVVADPLTLRLRGQIVQFAAQHRLPSVYGTREFVDAGGLMSYGTNVADSFRRAAFYIDKVLKGARPADLPVEQPTKFEMVVNLRTAHTHWV